jgi:hypothetical protein
MQAQATYLCIGPARVVPDRIEPQGCPVWDERRRLAETTPICSVDATSATALRRSHTRTTHPRKRLERAGCGAPPRLTVSYIAAQMCRTVPNSSCCICNFIAKAGSPACMIARRLEWLFDHAQGRWRVDVSFHNTQLDPLNPQPHPAPGTKNPGWLMARASSL